MKSNTQLCFPFCKIERYLLVISLCSNCGKKGIVCYIIGNAIWTFFFLCLHLSLVHASCLCHVQIKMPNFQSNIFRCSNTKSKNTFIVSVILLLTFEISSRFAHDLAFSFVVLIWKFPRDFLFVSGRCHRFLPGLFGKPTILIGNGFSLERRRTRHCYCRRSSKKVKASYSNSICRGAKTLALKSRPCFTSQDSWESRPRNGSPLRAIDWLFAITYNLSMSPKGLRHFWKAAAFLFWLQLWTISFTWCLRVHLG